MLGSLTRVVLKSDVSRSNGTLLDTESLHCQRNRWEGLPRKGTSQWWRCRRGSEALWSSGSYRRFGGTVNTLITQNISVETATFETTWVQSRKLSFCYCGYDPGKMHRFPQEWHQSKVSAACRQLFPCRTTVVRDLRCFTTEQTHLNQHTETTETQSDLNVSLHNHVSQALFLQYYASISKNYYKNNLSF